MNNTIAGKIFSWAFLLLFTALIFIVYIFTGTGLHPWVFFLFCIPAAFYLQTLSVPLLSGKVEKAAKKIDLPHQPEIALLMTVCNDFNKNGADSLLEQDYKNYHIFILDDSSHIEEKKRVTQWCLAHKEICTRIQRDSNKGYKAGNLNNAEKFIPPQYGLYCIVDSDQHLPVDFLTRLTGLYFRQKKPAFIQTIHKGLAQKVTPFSKHNSATVFPRWKYFLPYKNLSGIPTVLGHGYLLERAALNSVGGHPEVVSEDLALTMRLYAEGFHGYISPELYSYEIYPESLWALTKRIFKYIMADWEIIFSKYFFHFSKSKIGLSRKIDLVLRELRFPAGTLYLFTLFLFLSLRLAGVINLTPDQTINPIFQLFIYLFTFNPLFPTLYEPSYGFTKKTKALFFEIFTAYSMITLHFGAALSFLIHKKGIFWVTNEKKRAPGISGPNGLLTITIDIALSLLMVLYGIVYHEPVFIPIGLSPLLRVLITQKTESLENYLWIPGILIFLSGLIQLLLTGGIGIASLLLIFSFIFLIF